jgi:transposase
MEHLIALYNRPYDPAEPTLCFDERPCFLIGDTVVPLPMKNGASKREHYEYQKLGSCVLMVAVDPRAGWRFARIFQRRRKQEYAQFMKDLMDDYRAHRPEVRRVHLVQDNLNTHHAGSFYEQFDAETAHDLQQFYRFHFTPKGASWLNMVEIELSAIVRACLSRRIADQDTLEREVMALVRERNEKQIPIRWQFSVDTARGKLNRHYRAAYPDNAMYQRT